MSWLLLSSAALAGLLSGFHCLAMCGGISTAITSTPSCNRECAHPCAKSNTLFPTIHSLYWCHVGRILSYSLLGIAVGTLGSSLFWSHTLPHISYYLRLITGIVMVALGGQALFFYTKNSKSEPNSLTQFLNKTIQHFSHRHSAMDSLWIGLCWGLIPCGMIYALLATALTIGNPIVSGLFMLSFGLGTLPILLLAGHMNTWLQKRWSKLRYFNHWSSVVLIISGVWIFITGLQPPEQHAHHHHFMMMHDHESI